MKDIAYDHLGEIKVMSAAELESVPYLYGAIEKREMDRERWTQTLRRMEKRAGKVKPGPMRIVWHVRRQWGEPACEGVTRTSLVTMKEFARKMKGRNTICCYKCRGYYKQYYNR